MTPSFSRKSLTHIETLGEKLRRVREEAKIALEDLAQRSGIPSKYLHALETARYDQLPGDVYVRNFLRVYSETLNLRLDRVYELYEHERRVVRQVGPSPALPQELHEARSINIPRILRRGAIVLGVLLLLVYLGAKVNATVQPPELTVLSPTEDLVTQELSMTIEGVAESESIVHINGQEIVLEPNGHFAERIDLQPGLNIIKISAQKERSREHIQYRRVIVERTAEDGISYH